MQVDGGSDEHDHGDHHDDEGPVPHRPRRSAVPDALCWPADSVPVKRGVRADQIAPGSGLGLAIVRDLAELYGGSVALTDSRIGGLRARLRLPAC
jgi:hypothetical protein